MANTVPGTAQGTAIKPSSALDSQGRRGAPPSTGRETAIRAAARPRATAAIVETAAIQSELTTGRSFSVWTRPAQLPSASTGGKGSDVQVNGGTKETRRSTACGRSRKAASSQPSVPAVIRAQEDSKRR